MKRFGFLILLATLAFGAIETRAQVYELAGAQGPSSTALANRNIDGVRISLGWRDVEPQDGVFQWTGIDSQINTVKAAGKAYFELDVGAGVLTPDWIYTEGTPAFSFIWDRAFGPPYCTVVPIPIPWDRNYLTKFAAMVAALAARYGADPMLRQVKITGVNSETDEWFLPHSPGGEPINGGQCFSNNDLANWQAMGYSGWLVRRATVWITAQFAHDFPATAITMQVVRNPMPFGSPTAAQLLAAGRSHANFLSQSSSWTPRFIFPGLNVYEERTPMQGKFATAVANLLATRATNPSLYAVELYDADITSTANQAALAALHGALN